MAVEKSSMTSDNRPRFANEMIADVLDENIESTEPFPFSIERVIDSHPSVTERYFRASFFRPTQHTDCGHCLLFHSNRLELQLQRNYEPNNQAVSFQVVVSYFGTRPSDFEGQQNCGKCSFRTILRVKSSVWKTQKRWSGVTIQFDYLSN